MAWVKLERTKQQGTVKDASTISFLLDGRRSKTDACRISFGYVACEKHGLYKYQSVDFFIDEPRNGEPNERTAMVALRLRKDRQGTVMLRKDKGKRDLVATYSRLKDLRIVPGQYRFRCEVPGFFVVQLRCHSKEEQNTKRERSPKGKREEGR